MITPLITYELDGNLALIGLNRPEKRNAINDPLIDELRTAVLRAHEEADVAVLFGQGSNFCAGLDLGEALARATGQIKPARKRRRHNWHEVFDLIARGPIPFVGALHGAVVGGGLELAAATHLRVADETALFGLPEGQRGIFVGGGGTVRIQRMVGTAVMMDMMLTGRLLNPTEGLQEHIVRYVTPPGEALVKARELAARIATNSVETNWMIINVLPRIHDMSHDDGLFVEQLNSARARPPEAEARLREFVDGKARKLQDNQAWAPSPPMSTNDFFSVSDSQREDALAHARIAATRAAIIPGIPTGTPLRPVNRVAVIGAGTMGGGIAMALVNIGVPVTLIDAAAEGLERGLARVRDNYATTVRRGKLSPADMDQRMALITGSLVMADVMHADLVIEAVFEDMDLKQGIFRQLDSLARPGAILATNTSGLDVDAIAAATQRPQDVVGAHFFSPAHVMKLLEVVRGAHTAPDVIATLMDLGRRMGKIAVLARIYPGFIGNALFRNYTREAHFLVEDGALPHEVDAALMKFGYAMGIFAVHDMAGNDVGYQTRKAQMATRPNDRRWNDLILKLCDLGRLGQKSGKGWYRYENGDRTPHRDPELEDFIIAESARMGITRRSMTEEEIIKRCLYGMINEGARLLEHGIALRPGDVDTVYLTGYGFPAHHGGPLYLADRIGLDNVLADIRRLHSQYGFWWQPAPLLEKLVSEGRRFADLEQDS